MNPLDIPSPSPKQTNLGYSPHPIPIPPTCQPPGKKHPSPQCHPGCGEGGSAGVIAGAWATMGLAPAGTPGIPPGTNKEHQTPAPGIWVRAADPGWTDASSKGSYSGTSPLPPPQGNTPEAAGRICATKLLPQEDYVNPAYLPRANRQPRDPQVNSPGAHLDPSGCP